MTTKKKALATKTISCRVTENEFNTITQFAADAGMNRSEYYRHRLLEEQTEPRKRISRFVSIDQELASQLLSKLGATRCFSNLNQIAKAINQGVTIASAETEASLLAELIFLGEFREFLVRASKKRPRSDK